MDTELARTFLTVIAAGNFSHAASRLHVTQSTVSARIGGLEEQLGCRLFVRNKGGTTLTPAGRRFQRHAAALVRTVALARQDIGTADGFSETLSVGGRFGLWDDLLLHWLPRMRARLPDVALRAEIGLEDELMQGLVDGRLDLGVMYTPQSRPGLTVERLFDERVVLVSTRDRAGTPLDDDYVYVDWGPEFAAQHDARFPGFTGPAVTTNVGWLGLEHILRAGGAGYFPIRLIHRALERGVLHLANDAPGFVFPVFLVYTANDLGDALAIAVETIREVAALASALPMASAN